VFVEWAGYGYLEIDDADFTGFVNFGEWCKFCADLEEWADAVYRTYRQPRA
jgi:hypothetical protein